MCWDRDAFRTAFSEVLDTMDALFILSLVLVMKGFERRHIHVANYGIKCIQNLSGTFYEEKVSKKHWT